MGQKGVNSALESRFKLKMSWRLGKCSKYFLSRVIIKHDRVVELPMVPSNIMPKLRQFMQKVDLKQLEDLEMKSKRSTQQVPKKQIDVLKHSGKVRRR